MNAAIGRTAALILTVSTSGFVCGTMAQADPAKTLHLVREVALRPELAGASGALAVDSQRHRLFLTTPTGNAVYVIAAETGKLLKRIESRRAAVPVYESTDDRLTIFSGGTSTAYDARTYALDSNTGRELETLPLPAGTNGLAFDTDAQRLYALNHGMLRVYQRAGAGASATNHLQPAHFAVDAPFAESLVRATLSACPDLRKMGLHAVPPGGRVSLIIANGNATRIGIPTTPGDFSAIASGTTYGPKIDDCTTT